MGVLENIKQWWKSTAPKEEAFDYVMPPPSKEEKEELRAMKESLRALTRSLFSFLGDETAEKLVKRVSAAFKFEDDKTSSFACALRDGLYGDYFIKNRRPPYLLLFEARYVEDVIPMVGSVCRSYQIDATDFVFDEQNESLEPVYFFGRFNSWITQKQFETVIFDSCGDEYCCFLVPANSLDSVLKQLQTLGIEAYNIPGQM